MKAAATQALAGALLIAASGAIGRGAAADRPRGEPLALLLEPLGPAKALCSAALWVAVLHEHQQGVPEKLVPLSRALLELHPGLDAVREFLAGQLIVTEAARATDAARHAALVQAGLSLLEEGRLRSDSPRLHAALGRLLCVQRARDPAFEPVVEAYFGGSLTDLAIESLARSPDPEDGRLRAGLLVERGLAAAAAEERGAARADLAEAEAALEPLRAEDASAAGELEALLAPLREVLERRAGPEERR
ncbi:MAG TPA: hypothetical protein VFD43_04605 [Planctomycetota bacterium]|nr:hypothetical protein [Planctomycetota bacterium]